MASRRERSIAAIGSGTALAFSLSLGLDSLPGTREVVCVRYHLCICATMKKKESEGRWRGLTVGPNSCSPTPDLSTTAIKVATEKSSLRIY